jgi:hypothetical protein
LAVDREVVSTRLAVLDENRLVHDYIRLDRTRVHAFLATRLGGLRRFAAEIGRALE